jgi:hypothetical protein
MQTPTKTEEMYLRLTDGDMDYGEYINYIEQQVITKPLEYSQCIKCSYTRKHVYGQCIIRN